MSNEKAGFKNSETLTKWVRYFIYIQVIVAGISLLSNYMEYQFLSDSQNGVYTSQEQAVADDEANYQRQGVITKGAITMIYFIVFIVSGFLILKWIYRANYNARQLGANEMTFTPGWSVGWYFVPIFSLWKPYQAMKQIWKASHNPNDWINEKSSSLLGWWWFFWIVTNLFGDASELFRTYSMEAEEVDELIILNMINQASKVFSIPLAFVTLAVINRIYAAQVSHGPTSS